MINRTMSKQLVVGIDGSNHSARALEFAAAEAVLAGRELEILHALEVPTPVDFYGVQVAAPDATSMQGYAEELLASAEKQVRSLQPDLTVRTRYEIGSPTWVLAEASTDAAGVVVGSRGLGAVGSAVLGSVSSRLATHAECPLFVVGDQDQLPDTGPIVIGVDDSDFSSAACRFALEEAVLRRTTVRAVTAYRIPALAVPVEPQLITELKESERIEAGKLITEIVRRSRTPQTQDVEVEAVAVEGAPADVILDQARDAQLIVLGSHGKGLVRRLLLGSVGQQVLQDADRPVAIIDFDKPSESDGA
jgi:nucleotide-binding universal stress UspA family protein